MARQNVDYGYDVQKLYLEILLTDATTFVRCQSIYDSTLFDRKLQKPAEYLANYVKEYNVLPTFEMVNSSCKQELINPGPLASEHYDWLLTEFEIFTRHKSLERAIINASVLLEEGDYGPVEDMIKQAVQIGLTKDIGTDYWEDPKTRLLSIKNSRGQLSTSWPTLDKKLFGGFSRGELEVFIGTSGGGKSLFLANLGVNWALSGLNVVYVTLELSEALVSMRMDSMITGIGTREILKDIDGVELRVKMAAKKSGAVQIKYLPSGKNANDIRSYLKEYETKTHKKVDILLVDYLDLMMPISKKVNPSDLFIKDKFVSEELRNLATELGCVVVSAAQFNRGGTEEIEYEHSHIAGGISKIHTADNVFGIYSSRAMRERGKYQLQIMKTRSSSGVGQKIDLDFNVDTLKITDPEIEDDNQGSQAVVSSVLDSIKRKSKNPDPIAEHEEVKIKATTNSTMLRQFINNISDPTSTNY